MKTNKNLILLGLALSVPFVTYNLLSLPIMANGEPKPKEIKVDSDPETRSKYQNVALQPSCPRVTTGSVSVSLETVQVNDHCPSCNMGVFFARSQEKISCSYCEIEKTL